MDDLLQTLAAIGEGFLIVVVFALIFAIVLLLEERYGEDKTD
jgi:hypothetical protein